MFLRSDNGLQLLAHCSKLWKGIFILLLSEECSEGEYCRLFAWLLDHHEAEGADVRLRVCQLLNKLLKYMGEDAFIDDSLYYR